MDFGEAQRLIRDPAADYVDHMEAAMILAESPASTDDDLRACLALGGLPAELARTRRHEAAAVSRADPLADTRVEVIEAELGRLPAALADVLRSSSSGMTVPQIAAKMGLSQPMVARRLTQARRAITERLREADAILAESSPRSAGYGAQPMRAASRFC